MKLLVATDGTQSAEFALDHVAHLPLREGVPEILVLTVSRTAAGISTLANAKALLRAHGLTGKALWRVGEDVAATIVETAVDEKVDLIVLGCRTRQQSGAAPPDSVSDGVACLSPVPVLVVKTPEF
ncbi:MAG: universal stress protein [Candidatus Sericytochromatia bacterium]|nr:universal stress protein [Candidatus Tanganyikabacteria bacterium]